MRSDAPSTPIFDLPPRERRILLERGTPVYLLVNPVEYHGPHLSLHNDRLVSQGLAADLHERLQGPLGEHPLLIADDLEMGVDPCPGPGSRPDSLRAVRRRVVAACEGLADLGAQRVFLLSFHGSPMHSIALQAGVHALKARGVRALVPLSLALHELIDGRTQAIEGAFQTIEDPRAREAVRAAAHQDFHAGFFETSLSLHYAPHTVDPRWREVPACPAWRADPTLQRLSKIAADLGRERLSRELAFAAEGTGWYSLRPFPGYSGRPDLANPDAGAIFAEALLDRYTAHALEVFEGAQPVGAILPWLAPLTLDGRLSRSHELPMAEPPWAEQEAHHGPQGPS